MIYLGGSFGRLDKIHVPTKLLCDTVTLTSGDLNAAVICHKMIICATQYRIEIYDKRNLKKIKEYFYSPAELINMYVTNKSEKKFMERLLQNKKV
jgi:phosphopantetheine adenylyltransferase